VLPKRVNFDAQAWGGTHDLGLLKGVIKHGYGAWQRIAADPELKLMATLQEEAGYPAYLQRCEKPLLPHSYYPTLSGIKHSASSTLP